jgi:hypothetical protein
MRKKEEEVKALNFSDDNADGVDRELTPYPQKECDDWFCQSLASGRRPQDNFSALPFLTD